MTKLLILLGIFISGCSAFPEYNEHEYFVMMCRTYERSAACTHVAKDVYGPLITIDDGSERLCEDDKELLENR
jgi:hypothetical protein